MKAARSGLSPLERSTGANDGRVGTATIRRCASPRRAAGAFHSPERRLVLSRRRESAPSAAARVASHSSRQLPIDDTGTKDNNSTFVTPYPLCPGANHRHSVPVPVCTRRPASGPGGLIAAPDLPTLLRAFGRNSNRRCARQSATPSRTRCGPVSGRPFSRRSVVVVNH